MGFKVTKGVVIPSITVNDLDPVMIFDLITCYAYDYSPEAVECRVPAHDGITPMGYGNSPVIPYSIISKDVVQQFYDQLDLFRDTVKDIIVGNYHTGLYEDNRDNNWKWGTTPSNLTELLTWVIFVIKRDFAKEGTWMYTLTEGNIDALSSFISSAVNIFIQANNHGSYDAAIAQIKSDYPWTKENGYL